MIRFFRPAYVCAAAALLGAAFGGPAADARALAAAAGTAFEASPFFLIAWLIAEPGGRRFPRLRSVAPWLGLAGCGCSRGALPGALSIPALALTALTFGPFVALARLGGGLAALVLRARARPADHTDFADPLRALEGVAASAFASSLAVAALGSSATRISWLELAAGGMLVGIFAPCATAGVAIAGAFVHAAPAVTTGVLLTSGIVRAPNWFSDLQATDMRADPRLGRSARFAAATLAAGLAVLAVRGPSGLVNPRLLVPIALASFVALAYAFTKTSRTQSAWPVAVPVAMFAALVHPASMPEPRAEATRLDDAYAGEALAFTGTAQRSGSATTLARLAITCCRLDASPIAVRLDRALAVGDGTWVDARGILTRSESGPLVLHVDAVRPIAAPADPFVYR